MFTLITVPDASAMLSSISAYSGGIFTELVALVLIGVGVIAGALFAVWVGRKAMGAIKTVAGGRKGGRGGGFRSRR